MKTSKILVLAICLVSATAFAQDSDKGFVFTIGEKILNFAGYSYLDLEKKLATSDKGLAECLTESTQMKFQRDKKDEELKACLAGGAASSPAPAESTPAATP